VTAEETWTEIAAFLTWSGIVALAIFIILRMTFPRE